MIPVNRGKALVADGGFFALFPRGKEDILDREDGHDIQDLFITFDETILPMYSETPYLKVEGVHKWDQRAASPFSCPIQSTLPIESPDKRVPFSYRARQA